MYSRPHPVGPDACTGLFEKEVCMLAGARFARKSSQLLGQQHGCNLGCVWLAGQQVPCEFRRVTSQWGGRTSVNHPNHPPADRLPDEVLLKEVL